MGDRRDIDDFRECWSPLCEDLVEWSEGEYRWLEHDHEGQLLAFAYGQSRSGKTVYHSPVHAMRPSRVPDLILVQSYLFWPTEGEPEGELNRPYTVHAKRLHHPDLVPWDKMEGHPRGLFEANERAWRGVTA